MFLKIEEEDRVPAVTSDPNKLPDKLSDLLLLAVGDAQHVEGAGVTLDMSCWVSGEENCRACMAGAVMLRRRSGLRPPTGRSWTPGDLPWGDAVKLLAVNDLRTGGTCVAAHRLGFSSLSMSAAQQDALREARVLIGTDFNPRLERAPWATYEKAAAILKGAGL